MKKTILYGFIIIAIVGFVTKSNPQEILVPLDEEGKLERIDSNLENKLGFFPDYKNFHEARLFQITDTTFVLEIFYRSQKALLKDRVEFTAEDVQDFRRKVSEQIKKQVPQAVLNQEGRPELLGGTLALSLGYYGWALPAALDVQEQKLAVALYMFTSSGSFFLPFWLTREISVTRAEASLSFYGGTRGIAHGILMNMLLFGKESSDRGVIASGMFASIAETVLGFYIAGKTDMEPGKAAVIGVGGDFGFGWGLGMAHLANFLEKDNNERSIAGTVLLGSATGLLTGTFLANQQPYSRGDAAVLRAVGILGAYVPLAMVDFTNPKDKRYYTATSMIGSIVGLRLGHTLVKGKDFSTGYGTLITLGELAGGLVGLGGAYLVSSENAENSSLFLTSSSIGAMAGFWLMYRSFEQEAQISEKGSSWNFNFNPEGLVFLALSRSSVQKRPVPLLTCNFRF